MELMEDNHRVEVRVYLQKVKHLEYEHNNNLRNIAVEGECSRRLVLVVSSSLFSRSSGTLPVRARTTASARAREEGRSEEEEEEAEEAEEETRRR